MKKTLGLIALSGLMVSAPVLADMDVGVTGGLNGAGVRLGLKLNDALGVRLEGTKWSLSEKTTIDDIRYKADADIGGVGAYLDWHPFSNNSFRLSAGFAKSLHELRAKNISTGTVDIGGDTYTVQPGDVFGKASFDTAPYIGIGWGRTGAKGWGFAVDIGAWYLGKSDVNLDVSQNIRNQAALAGYNIDQDIADEERKARNDIGEVWYPNLSITVKYGF